jgi:hypothetical protein
MWRKSESLDSHHPIKFPQTAASDTMSTCASRVTSSRTLRITWRGVGTPRKENWNENAKTKHQSSGFGAEEDRHRRETPASWAWISRWRFRWSRRCLAWLLGPRPCRTLATSITDRESRTMVPSRRAVRDRFLRFPLSPFSGAQKTRRQVRSRRWAISDSKRWLPCPSFPENTAARQPWLRALQSVCHATPGQTNISRDATR